MSPHNRYQLSGHPFFILAPMDDVTDTVFRQVIQRCAPPDLFMTEFVNVDGLQSPGRDKLMKRLRKNTSEDRLIAQLWGLKPENYYKTAQELLALGFVGVDINMGCPDKTVVKNGACSALINNRPLALEIIAATKAGAGDKLPVSVKTRLGFGEVDFTWHEFLLKQDIDMLTIHGRTRSQMSKVPADFTAIGRVRELRDRLAPDTLIVGNGDVFSLQAGQDLAKQYKLDGIMIGRGIFNDPYVFAEESPWLQVTPAEKISLYALQVQSFADTWKHQERPIQTLNKFCKVYINGFEGAKELREQLMGARSAGELLDLLSNAQAQRDFDQQPAISSAV